ncbi:Asp-tRNA(Asn)/Glu-tRNA(Gln) amidotransferase subunit GatC [Candidatus Daviesbacteria bacterium]|nr:Asp-tRNA(Asn)/Glu-tRNA(Gln) amidotransferase subunit GatC [Candidatus Daviesbacteria bacterium]
MKLTKDQVKKVAKLANLPLNDQEITLLEDQLSETLKFVEQLDQVSTEKVEATQQVTGLSNIMRPDETKPSLSQREALQNAHINENGFFKVKAIFEEQ